LTSILIQLLRPRLHGADQVSLSYGVGYDSTINAIYFQVYGFSQHLPLLAEEILQQIQGVESDITPELFESVKSDIISFSEDMLLQPNNLSE